MCFGLRHWDWQALHYAVSAHIDFTVFPAGTPLNIRQQGSRLYGPGVSDNGAGLTCLCLATAAALNSAKIAEFFADTFHGKCWRKKR